MAEQAEEKLALFLERYCDGLESFDWWILRKAQKPDISISTLAEEAVRGLKKDSEQHEEGTAESLRCILWLDEMAIDPLRNGIGKDLGYTDKMAFIARHPWSPALRSVAEELQGKDVDNAR